MKLHTYRVFVFKNSDVLEPLSDNYFFNKQDCLELIDYLNRNARYIIKEIKEEDMAKISDRTGYYAIHNTLSNNVDFYEVVMV